MNGPTSATAPAGPDILKGAALSGIINAVINGAIQFFLLRGSSIPLSVESISAGTHTVPGSAVPLAVSLAMILTAVAHRTLKGRKKPFLPTTLWLVVKHGLFAFGKEVVTLPVAPEHPAFGDHDQAAQEGRKFVKPSRAKPKRGTLVELREGYCAAKPASARSSR